MRLRGEDLTWQEIDGELVILDLTRSSYLTTNGTGAFLAKLLVTEHSADELATALAAEYGIAEADAREDVDAFVAELSRLELLDDVAG
jgi:hypothetical protein